MAPYDKHTGAGDHDDQARIRPYQTLVPPATTSLGRALQNVVNAQNILSDGTSDAGYRSTTSTAPGSPKM